MPKIVDHNKYKAEVFNLVYPMFGEHGYASLTTRQIAQAAGISTGRLYHYFDSKEDLFHQLTEWTVANEQQRLRNLAPEKASFEERLDLLIAMFREREEEIRLQLEVLLEFKKENPQVGLQLGKNAMNLYVDAISETLNIQNSLLAEIIFSTVFGLLFRLSLNEDQEAFDKQIDLMKQLILQQA